MTDSDIEAEKAERLLLEQGRREREQFMHETTMRRHAAHESLQKLFVRWFSVCAGTSVMLLAAWILVYHLFLRPVTQTDSAFAWIVVAAPIASLTIIAVAFLIAGFPRRGDQDASESMRESAGAAANISGGGDIV